MHTRVEILYNAHLTDITCQFLQLQFYKTRSSIHNKMKIKARNKNPLCNQYIDH